ncbi:MAG: PDZ domain-containing protein [Planctomycetota bacterium]|nr:MAG: PDZ domain-containing protein [Planctomycetota bacterium]REK46058.1 MAG: PDZ domain-containing protein [Planctomycetota bacterium]
MCRVAPRWLRYRSSIRFCFVLVLTLLLLAVALPVRAQEPGALAAAMAMEKLLIEAIERSQQSVVAIGIFGQTGRRRYVGGFGRARSGPSPPRPELADVPDRFGTGVAIGERLILTNHHVVLGDDEDASNQAGPSWDTFIRVAGHQQWLLCKVKAADPRSDLAVLEIDAQESAAPKLEPIKFADADQEVKKGQIVIALGNPYAIARDGEVSASWGIVSNINRRVSATSREQTERLQHYGGLIQTDAKLNLGTSGGALINLQGEMVGLTTSVAATAGYETPAGYAIACDAVFQRALAALREGREVEYGLLGVKPRSEFVANGAEPPGVLVTSVVDQVPANRVLDAGDVITHVDGRRLYAPGDLMMAIGRRAPGESVLVRFVTRTPQGPRSLQRPVQLNKFPVDGQQVVTAPRPAWRGAHVDYPRAVPAMVSFLEDTLPSHCLEVTQVDPDSPAAAAGIEPGTLIREAAGRSLAGLRGSEIAMPANFREVVDSREGPVELYIRKPTSTGGFERVVVGVAVAAKEDQDAAAGE